MSKLATRTRTFTQLAALVITAALGGAGGCAAPSDEVGDVKATQGQLVGPNCSVTQQTNCWDRLIDAANYRKLDVGNRLACAVATGACPTATTCEEKVMKCINEDGVIHQLTDVFNAGVQSIAIASSFASNRKVYVLGKQGALYTVPAVASKDLASYHNGFGPPKLIAAHTTLADFSPLCLKKITAVLKPAINVPDVDILGLGCTDGRIYVFQGATWKPHVEVSPWSGLPSEAFTDISHDNAIGGGTFLTASGTIWHAGAGTVTSTGAKIFEKPWKLPVLPLNLKATAVGGAFVITNSSEGARTLRYISRSTMPRWVLAGVGSPEGAEAELSTLIVDGSTLRGREDEFGIWHGFGRAYRWKP